VADGVIPELATIENAGQDDSPSGTELFRNIASAASAAAAKGRQCGRSFALRAKSQTAQAGKMLGS